MYIYKTTNLINGKIYIGLKQASPEDSIQYYGSGVYLNKAIEKYGIKNFKKEIIERDIESYEELCESEIKWIAHYQSNKKSIGYNKTSGGNGVRGYEFTEEDKDLLSKQRSGRKWYHDPITLKNVFIKGEPPIGYVNGRYFNKESRSKMSKNKGKSFNFSKERNIKISKALTGGNLTTEQRSKISASKKGRSWYHNPDTGEQTMSHTCPLGFKHGRIR